MTRTQEMLKPAEARVAAGEAYIALQWATIARLSTVNQDARAALELLSHLEAAQKILEEDRDRLRRGQ